MLDPHPLLGRDVVVDGIRLHVVSHGRHGGVPLLLLHGVPTSSYLWRNVMRDLESKVPTVAPDLVGLGRSERPRRRGYRLTEQAALLHGLLDELALPQVVVAGHDEGGAVAVQLAAMAPDRVTGIALLASPVHRDAWPPPAAVPLLVPGVGSLGMALMRRRPALARWALSRLLGPRPEPELAHYAAPLLAAEGARGLLRLVAGLDLRTTESALAKLRSSGPPALVLWGTEDRVRSAAYGRRLADELPGAVFVPVSGGGHLLPEECPERVAEELAGFVAELPVALPQPADQ